MMLIWYYKSSNEMQPEVERWIEAHLIYTKAPDVLYNITTPDTHIVLSF